MKYLVNKETKEHIVYHEEHSLPLPGWDIVEADSDGWIPWSGGECPLSEGAAVAARYRCGEEFEGHALKDSNFATVNAGARFWRNDCAHPYDIIAYRPILTEQSEPETPSELQPHSVFDRLRTATEHAASIPAIIAEIDELLGPDYQVVRVEKIEATAPQEDMSDWRNWREGDLVELKDDAEPISGIRHCVAYRVGRVTKQGFSVVADCEGLAHGFSSSAKHFKFISRPTGATK